MNQADICEKFFWHVRSKFRSQKQAAAFYGVTSAMVSLVTTGVRMPTDKMLEDMGYQKVVSYEKI